MTTHRHREANQITAVVAVVCATACASAVVPGLEHTITVALLTLVGLVATVAGTRFAVGLVRERREDRADALAVALWRTEHAPHRLDHTDRAALTRHTRHSRQSAPAPVRTVPWGVA